MHQPCEGREGFERGRLGVGERPTGVVTVTGDDDAIPDERGDGRRGRGPVERVAIAEEGDCAVLEQVAGPQHARPRDRDDDVVIGVAAAKELELDTAPAHLDRCGVDERPVGRVDHDLSQIGGQIGLLESDLRTPRLARSFDEGDATLVPPDRRRAEDVVPVGMVEVAVRVHDGRDRSPGQLPDVREDLACLRVRGARVDDQRLAVAEHESDVLVVERVPANEEAIADLDPTVRDSHRRMVSMGGMPDRRVAYAAPMPSIVGRVTAADGTDLLTRHWPADEAEAGGAWAGEPWGSVLLVHGLGDRSGRYEHVGDQFAAAGLDAWAYDQRGNGGSGGRRGDLERWSQFHDDLAQRLAAVRAGAGPRPVVLYGHSMGGLVVAGYLLSDRPKPDVAVLASPGLDSALPGWKKGLARFLARVTPTLPIPNGIRGSTLSRDPTVGEKVAADPLNATTSTARFGAAGLAEQARVRALAQGGFGIPTLVLHGEDDGLVPVGASAVLEGAPGVERRTYPGLRHELHNEPEGPEILDEVITWLRAQVGK